MKTVLLIVALGIGSLSSFASNGVGTIKNELSNSLKYPKSAKEKGLQGLVIVEIIINPDGTASVTEMMSSDPCFEDYVLEKVSELEFEKNDSRIGEKFLYKVKFERR